MADLLVCAPAARPGSQLTHKTAMKSRKLAGRVFITLLRRSATPRAACESDSSLRTAGGAPRMFARGLLFRDITQRNIAPERLRRALCRRTITAAAGGEKRYGFSGL